MQLQQICHWYSPDCFARTPKRQKMARRVTVYLGLLSLGSQSKTRARLFRREPLDLTNELEKAPILISTVAPETMAGIRVTRPSVSQAARNSAMTLEGTGAGLSPNFTRRDTP